MMIKNIANTVLKSCELFKVPSRSLFLTGYKFQDKSPKAVEKAGSAESDLASGESKIITPATVLVEKDGPITLIGINRPQKRNAVDPKTAELLSKAFTDFENDEKSSVAVLYGCGGSFCSGYDLNELATEGNDVSIELLMTADGSVGPTRRNIAKPVVCAINGYCVANGLELALMCDLRVMEECAILGFFNRRFGVPVIDGGTVRLPAMIGYSRALDLILTGRQVGAEEACAMGIANRVVATGTALGQAVNLAYSIAKFPQRALNHDRNSLFSNTFESPSFNASVQNEIMYTSKEVLDEMKLGIQKFIKGQTQNPKCPINERDDSMADWEKHEIEIENSLKQKKKPNDK